MHEQYEVYIFYNAAFRRMRVFVGNGWPRCAVSTVWLAVIGSPQSIQWYVLLTSTRMISAILGHRKDWSQELSHQSFHTW